MAIKGYTELAQRPPGPRGSAGDDDVYYLAIPGHDFAQPWIASPNGTSGVAFTWPLGIQGFSYNSNATASVHHYIGENGVDVSLVFPDELHIVLNGTFPGKSATRNMHALRQVILHQSEDGKKLLGLPLIESQILYVKTISHSFSRDSSGDQSSVSYSIEFIKTLIGAALVTPSYKVPASTPAAKVTPRGKDQKRTAVKGSRRSIRGVSNAVYGRTDAFSQTELLLKNQGTWDRLGIPRWKIPFVRIPPGTTIEF